MKENSIKNERSSIEEDIVKKFEEFCEDLYIFKDDDMGGHFEGVVGDQIANTKLGYLIFKEKLEDFLSDYKRVLKENEYMHNELNKQQTTINKYAKENEELKEDRKNNNEMIALAQNKILNYMRGYEDGKKHKMTAVAQVVENQQYYIVQKQMEKYEELIKSLQKENKELKNLLKEKWS